MLLDHGFAPAEGYSREQAITKDMRPLTGTGTPFLPCPGLKEVKGVRVGHMQLPDKLPMNLPLDPGLTRIFHHDVRCYQILVASDGTPVLQRSIYSNDGIWQTGETIYVSGEWDEQVSPPPGAPIPESAHQRPVLLETRLPAAEVTRAEVPSIGLPVPAPPRGPGRAKGS